MSTETRSSLHRRLPWRDGRDAADAPAGLIVGGSRIAGRLVWLGGVLDPAAADKGTGGQRLIVGLRLKEPAPLSVAFTAGSPQWR
jgi:hypothetical protein